MSNWNGKLECIKSIEVCGSSLTKGKIYDVRNGIFQYDSRRTSAEYDGYQDLITLNPFFEDVFIEHKDPECTWGVKGTSHAKYITINDEVTIAIPYNTPMGITVRHPNDEYSEEIGESVAFKRLYDKMYG